MANFDFIVDVEEGRLINSYLSQRATTSPPFVYGDKPTVSVRLVESNSNNADLPWRQLDLTGQTIRLGIGDPGGDATGGTFTITYDGTMAPPVAYNATAADLEAAIDSDPGANVTVVARPDGFRITDTTNAAITTPTVDTTELSPSVSAYVTTVQEGSASLPEITDIVFETNPAAYIELTADMAAPSASITTVREGVTDTTAEQQRIIISGDPHAGTYSLTIDSEESGAIPYDASTDEITSAIEALLSIGSNTVTVTGTSLDYTIEFDKSLGDVGEATADVSNLSGAIGKTGTLDLNTLGILELLAGESSQQATLEIVRFTTSGSISDTVYQGGCTVKQDVIPDTPPSETPMPSYPVESEVVIYGDQSSAGKSTAEKTQARSNISAESYGSELLIVSNAAQGWWVSNNLVTFSDDYANASYAGFATMQGDWGVVRVDNDTGRHSRTVLGHDTIDDHNVPSFAQLPDGRVIVAYAKHATESKVYTKISQSSNLDDWGDEVEITTSGNATYASLRVVGNNLQLWYRTGVSSAGQWAMRYLPLLTNNPLTASQWGSERVAYNSEYLSFYENSQTAGQWKVFNTQHPISGSNHNIYYTFIQDAGTVVKPGGTTLGNVVSDSGLPITDTEGLKVVDAGTGTNTTRLLASGENVDDLPAIIYARFTTDGGGSDGNYYMGNYVDSTSEFAELSLGAAGDPIDDPVTSFYFGGGCFNTTDKNILYLIRESSGTWTLEEITVAADLLSYAASTLYSTTSKLVRPYYDNGRLFFTEFSNYVSYSNWIGDLKWIEV